PSGDKDKRGGRSLIQGFTPHWYLHKSYPVSHPGRISSLIARSSSGLYCSITARAASSAHSPASSAGAVNSAPRFSCRPLSRTSSRRAAAAAGAGGRARRHTTAQAMLATSSRRASAAAVSCCHASSCWPAALTSLKKLSTHHRQAYHTATS